MPKLSMAPKMTMRATPALLNLAHLLALPSMSLYQAVRQELMENPALEEVEARQARCARCDGPVVEGACLRCAGMLSADERSTYRADPLDQLLFVAAPRSLGDTLLADLYASLPASEHPIALALVGSLDDRGFLADQPAEIAAVLNISLERISTVLRLLRELGPPGIAAHDTRDCLLAQLDALVAEGGACPPHTRSVIAAYLDDLCAHRYTQIARRLRITVAEVEAVRDFIQRQLWPYPAQAPPAAAAEPDRACYRVPDLAISEQNGTFVVEVLNSPSRLLRLNPLYQSLARRVATLTEHERTHVQEYVARALMFLSNLHKRERTLRRIGEAIVARQQGFLRNGVRQLTPMTRLELASALGLHESTVCRAIVDKTALLPNGTLWPLSDFFAVARGVQDVLRELIANENGPLSDHELSRLLAERGHPIARRTVAKYRNQMKIPPCHLR